MGILKKFKDAFKEKHGIELDFRIHKYIRNNYGLSPIFDYELAENIVKFTYEFVEQEISKGNYEFSEYKYNLNDSVSLLEMMTAHDFILSKLDDLKIRKNHGMKDKQNAKKSNDLFTARLVLRCSKADKAIWTAEAKNRGMNLSEFTQSALNNFTKT